MVLTDVLAAVATHIAAATGEVERDGDLLSLFDTLNVLAGSDDTTGWFVTEDMWWVRAVAEPVPIALPAMPVRATDTTADDLGDSAVRVGVRSVDVLDRQRFLEALKEYCLHHAHICQMLSNKHYGPVSLSHDVVRDLYNSR